MITHKFREVTAYADEVSVLRRGKLAGGGKVAELGHGDMAQMMMGTKPPPNQQAGLEYPVRRF